MFQVANRYVERLAQSFYGMPKQKEASWRKAWIPPIAWPKKHHVLRNFYRFNATAGQPGLS